VRLLRHRRIRLSVLLLCAWSFLAPALNRNARGSQTTQSCSCPMCRTLGGSAHCACCEAGKCTCHMSSSEDNTQSILLLQPVVIPRSEEFFVIFPTAELVPSAQPNIGMPDLATPTPPPRG
jgi:hypothetical protein